MPRYFNPQLLMMCRHFREIGQNELADRAKITQGYLSKIEQGLIEPAPEACDRIAEALEFPVNLFFQNDRIYGMPVSVHAMFRKRSRVGKKEIDLILAEINFRIIHLRRFFELLVDSQAEYKIPHCDIDAYGGDIEEIARIVRATWLLPPGPIENLSRCAEEAGCIVFLCDFGKADIDGVTISVPDLPPGIFLNQNRPADRMRYTLAHEIGHLVMHAIPSPEMEDEANRFASALLMPASDIASELNNITLNKLILLKRKWKVAMSALLMRASSLDKLTKSQSRYLWVQMSKAGYRTREPEEFAPEKPIVLSQILKLYRDNYGGTSADLHSMLFIKKSEDYHRLYESGKPFLKVAS